MSGAEVPTWWTQAPEESTVFTGWMAGRAARAHAHLSSAQLLDVALQSLAQIFSMDKNALKSELLGVRIDNWSSDPYALGSYAYTTLGAGDAQKVLALPMAGRIFFAGEYMYDGPAMGTVEAAFSSGIETAGKLLKG
jgi:monoamine oxidase